MSISLTLLPSLSNILSLSFIQLFSISLSLVSSKRFNISLFMFISHSFNLAFFSRYHTNAFSLYISLALSYSVTHSLRTFQSIYSFTSVSLFPCHALNHFLHFVCCFLFQAFLMINRAPYSALIVWKWSTSCHSQIALLFVKLSIS